MLRTITSFVASFTLLHVGLIASEMPASQTKEIEIYAVDPEFSDDLERVFCGLEWLIDHTPGKTHLRVRGSVFKTFAAATKAKERWHHDDSESYLVAHGGFGHQPSHGYTIYITDEGSPKTILHPSVLEDKTNKVRDKFFDVYHCTYVTNWFADVGYEIAQRHGMDWSRVCRGTGEIRTWYHGCHKVSGDRVTVLNRLSRIWRNPFNVSHDNAFYTIFNTIFDVGYWGNVFTIQQNIQLHNYLLLLKDHMQRKPSV